MRILTVASEIPPVQSGVARSVGRIADGLVAAGHDVTTLSYADAPLLRRDRVRLSGLGLKVALRRGIRDDFDAVHLHGPAPTVSELILARWRLASPGVPLVYTHHFTVCFDRPWLRPAASAYDRLTRWLARAATIVVTTTPSYQALVRTGASQDCRVIAWGVDAWPADMERQPSTGPLRVLLVGQLRRYKGHDVAIDAVRDVDRLELTIVGEGPRRAALERATAGARNIAMLPPIDDEALCSQYLSHDVILLPSTDRSEAFGISLLEGMAAGCVPVASDLPGVDDVAGATGRLFPVGDARALRSVLLSLSTDRRGLAERSARSRALARDHPWTRTIEAYVRVMADVAGS